MAKSYCLYRVNTKYLYLIYPNRQGFMIVQSKSIQVKVPLKTYERLVDFAKAEGYISSSEPASDSRSG